jgi:hypothetical protein
MLRPRFGLKHFLNWNQAPANNPIEELWSMLIIIYFFGKRAPLIELDM